MINSTHSTQNIVATRQRAPLQPGQLSPLQAAEKTPVGMKKPKAAVFGAKQVVQCGCCSKEFSARVADIKRGWGKFCSKSCKAKDQALTKLMTADPL